MILMRLIVGPLQVNCYILADERTKEAVVIDPGDDTEDILKIVQDKGLSIKYIVNTHGHFDHVGANARLKEASGAEILLHEADGTLLCAAERQAQIFGIKTAASPPADRFLKDGDVIRAGEVSLKVLHTPGHTSGGISLLEENMVFTGDALFAGSIGRTDLTGGNMMTLVRSIKTKLLSLPEETRVFPGHGPDSTIGIEKKENPFLSPDSGFA